MKLTPKQEKFANLYVELGNASEAYRRSYSCKRMSEKQVWEESSKLINHPKVTQRVKQLQTELQRRSDISKDEAVKELSNVVRGRITDIFDIKQGSLFIKDLKKLPDEVVSCIESIKETNIGIEIKLYNKISAIDRLSKMMGWDEATKQEITGKDGKDLISSIQIIDNTGLFNGDKD